MDLIPREFFNDLFMDEETLPPFHHHELAPQMRCDIYEKDGKCFIEADMPGFSKEDVSIEVENEFLVIKAKNEYHKDKENKRYIRKERRFGEITRSFHVGNIDDSKIEASFKDGVLVVSFPKEKPESTKKLITIK